MIRKLMLMLFLVGLFCGFVMAAGVIFLSITGAEFIEINSSEPLVYKIFSISGNIFILIGVVLLFDAIFAIRLRWAGFSSFGKLGVIAGLVCTNILGSYMYFYFLRIKNY